MAQIQIANFADSTLASSIAGGDTTISFAATDPTATFPTLAVGDWFYAVLVDVAANREIIKVTAHTAGTRIFTVVRAQEGTGVTPDTLGLSFAVGSVISLRLTVQAFKDYVDAIALSVADIGVSVQAYDLETAKTDVAQTFTAQQTPMKGSLTDGATIDWDANDKGQSVKVTTAAARTFNAPTNIIEDNLYVLRLTTGGFTPAWNAAYKWGTAPSSLESATYVFTFIGGPTSTLIPTGPGYKTGA